MTGRGIWGDTITLVRRAVVGTDVYGNDVEGETRETLSGVAWQPVDTTETQTTTRDQLLAHFRVYIRGFFDITGLDAVEYECPAAGLIRAEVHGRPEVFRSASGRLDHTAVTLREIQG